MLKEDPELILCCTAFGHIPQDSEQLLRLSSGPHHRSDQDIPPLRNTRHCGTKALEPAGTALAGLRNRSKREVNTVTTPEFRPGNICDGSETFYPQTLSPFAVHGKELGIQAQHLDAVPTSLKH